MDPRDRIVEYLAAFHITDRQGGAADLDRMARELLECIGERKTIYQCVKRELEIPCEHQDHQMEIIVVREG